MSKKQNSPWFAIIFIATLLAISTGVFFAFTHYQRAWAQARRESSAQNLEAIHKMLMEYKRSAGQLPTTPAELAAIFKGQKEILIHPAWPDQPGYVYFSGPVNAGEGLGALFVFENVPDRKQKLGRQSISSAGTIMVYKDENAFNAALSATIMACKARSIPWRLIEIRAD